MAPTSSNFSPHRRKLPISSSSSPRPSLRRAPLRALAVCVAALLCVVWVVNSVSFLKDIGAQTALQAEQLKTPVRPAHELLHKPPVLAMEAAPAREDLMIGNEKIVVKPRAVRVTPSREDWPMKDEFYTSSHGDDDTSTTIIFNLFKGPAEALRIQLEAATAQVDVVPPEIWVMCFNSPMQQEYEAVVQDVREKTGSKIVLTVSDFNHKFHGRFLLAYMATTKYVLIIDDDKNIDSTTVKDYISFMKIKKGVWGNVGHVRAADFAGYKAWPKHFDSDYAEVDYLSGMWFLEQSWLEYFVKERMPSWATSEDMHLSHVMRKYLNLNTYGARVALGLKRLPKKKYAATVGSALDLREYIFDHQLGRGNKVATVDQPIDTLVYAETAEDIEDFIKKIETCETLPTPMLREATALPPWCDAGRTAAVFRGAKEQDVVGLIDAAQRLCAKTGCDYLTVKPKIKHPIRYFNMREGYGQESIEIPYQTSVADVVTSFVGVLNNLLPKQVFVRDSANDKWAEDDSNSLPGKQERLEIYHDTIRLAIKIHRNSPTNQKWHHRDLELSKKTAYPSKFKAFTWRYTPDNFHADSSSWKQLVKPLV